jgi:hypothetical protein
MSLLSFVPADLRSAADIYVVLAAKVCGSARGAAHTLPVRCIWCIEGNMGRDVRQGILHPRPQVSRHRVDHPDVVSPRVRRWCDLAVFFRSRACVSSQLRTLQSAARCSEPSRAARLQLLRRCERVPLSVLPVACARCCEPGNRCKAADSSSWMWGPMSPQRTRSLLHPAGQGGCPGHNHFSATQGPQGHPVVAAVFARYTQNWIVLAGAGRLPSCSSGACLGRRMRVSACLATAPIAWTAADSASVRRQTAGALRQVWLYNRSGA